MRPKPFPKEGVCLVKEIVMDVKKLQGMEEKRHS